MHENEFVNGRVIFSCSLLLLMCILSFGLFPLTAASNEQPKYGGTLITTVNGDPPTLNPCIDTSPIVEHSAGHVFQSLCQYGFDMHPRPELAESWEISKDATTFTFHLVRNATWHDGTPFTSADVKFTYEEVLRQFHPKTSSVLKKALDSVETPDSYTVIFKLKYPFAPFMSMLSVKEAAILPKHLYSGTDIMRNEYNAKPVGTGPFKFKEWVKGSYITLEKNKNYWRSGKPYLDRVIVKIIVDSTARVLSLKKGEIDYLWYTMLPSSEIAPLKEYSEITVTDKGLGWGTPVWKLYINLRRPYLKDIRVRKAIAYAIDKDAINKLVMFGLARPAISPIMSDCWAHNPNVATYNRNLEKANRLLDEAGYPKNDQGIRFELELTATLGSDFVKESEILKNQLAEVGIKAKLRSMEYATMIETVHVRWDFDIFVEGAGTGPDPAIGVSRFYDSSNIRRAAWTNIGGYNNSRVDWLLQQAERTTDMEKRKEYYYEFQEIVTDELPYIWLLEIPCYTAYRKEFVNVNSWNAYSYTEFEDVWWAKGEAPAATTTVATPTKTTTTVTTPTAAPAIGTETIALIVVIVVVVIAAVYWMRKPQKKAT